MLPREDRVSACELFNVVIDTLKALFGLFQFILQNIHTFNQRHFVKHVKRKVRALLEKLRIWKRNYLSKDQADTPGAICEKNAGTGLIFPWEFWDIVRYLNPISK